MGISTHFVPRTIRIGKRSRTFSGATVGIGITEMLACDANRMAVETSSIVLKCPGA
jgi:hypothetical protein